MKELSNKLDNFKIAWLELNEVWQESDTDVNGELDYPFHKCFNELQPEVVDWVEEFKNFLQASKKDEIENILISMWAKLGMDSPNNYEDIVQYCFEDVCDTADEHNWSDGDVVTAFRRWVEGENRED